MDAFTKILVPIDLSDPNESVIQIASKLAKDNNASIVFCFVALPPLPPEALYFKDELNSVIIKERAELMQIAPVDSSVRFEHVFLRGNPGPEIVKCADENGCDLIVMASQGRSGFLRWILGSVAEYVIRHSQCPVLTVKYVDESEKKSVEAEPVEQTAESDDAVKEESDRIRNSPFVTAAMTHSVSVHSGNTMQDTIELMATNHASAAPIVDQNGTCVGILTESDVQRFLDLEKVASQSDSEASTHASHVGGYMSSPVLTVPTTSTCNQAQELFNEHQEIHHLVVVSENNIPIGILRPENLTPLEIWEMTRDGSPIQ